MPSKPPVSLILEDKGIAHRIFRHKGTLSSVNQAAFERGQKPQQVIRSILFKITKGEYLMVLITGEQQVDWAKLRGYLNVSRIRLASHDEVLSITGYPPGAVSPFGLPQSVRIILDASTIQENEISIGSGFPGVAVILQFADLVKALKNVDVIDLGTF